MYMCMYMYMYMYVYMYICTYTHTRTRVCSIDMSACINTMIYKYVLIMIMTMISISLLLSEHAIYDEDPALRIVLGVRDRKPNVIYSSMNRKLSLILTRSARVTQTLLGEATYHEQCLSGGLGL